MAEADAEVDADMGAEADVDADVDAEVDVDGGRGAANNWDDMGVLGPVARPDKSVVKMSVLGVWKYLFTAVWGKCCKRGSERVGRID